MHINLVINTTIYSSHTAGHVWNRGKTYSEWIHWISNESSLISSSVTSRTLLLTAVRPSTSWCHLLITGDLSPAFCWSTSSMVFKSVVFYFMCLFLLFLPTAFLSFLVFLGTVAERKGDLGSTIVACRGVRFKPRAKPFAKQTAFSRMLQTCHIRRPIQKAMVNFWTYQLLRILV